MDTWTRLRWIGPRSWRGRLACLAAAAALTLAPAAGSMAAQQQSERIFYDYVKDKRAWYWEKQIDQEVTTPPGVPELPPEVPVPSQRVRLPNPQRPDTLPVAVFGGELERVSALQINLVDRGVTPNSEISKFVISIQESQDRNEQPSINGDAAAIIACPITEFWAGADDPQEWQSRPEIAERDCAKGKRSVQREVGFWRFDLTDLAQPWGEDPFSNNGVLLLGDVPANAGPSDTWQVNLKIPSRDVQPPPVPPGGTDPDEYKLTKGRLVAELVFVPGEEPPLPPPPDPVDTGTPITTPGTFTPSTDFSTPGTDFGDTTIPETTPETPEAPQALPAAQTQPAPALPGYVWALLPIGLLALGAVRSVVLEPIGGTRPDGAIAAIRRRNAERRGGPLREIRDPVARAFAATRRGAGAVGRWFQRTARSVRRR